MANLLSQSAGKALSATHFVKRKASGEAGSWIDKKAKHGPSQPIPVNGSQSGTEYCSSYDASSHPDSPSEASDEESATIATPITPFSPAGKYPSQEKTHICPFDGCNKAFNRPARLAEHINSHNNERPFVCTHDGCDKCYSKRKDLNIHVKNAHSDVRGHACGWEGCGKSFATSTRLKRHQAVHEGRERYRCSEYPPCNETFRKHTTLQKHITSVHRNQKPFPCSHVDPDTGEKCSQGYDTAGKLRAHEGRVHGGERFQCTICIQENDHVEGQASARKLVGFSTYALYQNHLRTVHPPECTLCDYVCSTQRELRQHIDINHSGQEVNERRTHMCDYPGCGRGFTKKSNLTVHKSTVHEGEKRWVCGETDLRKSKGLSGWTGDGSCGKGFTSKATLEEHTRTKHLGLERTARPGKTSNTDQVSRANCKAKEPSTLALLTGAGYAEESGRDLACLDSNCKRRFMRQYDLELHLRAKHGISHEDMLARATRNASTLAGGQFWGNPDFDSLEDQAAEMELDGQFDLEMKTDSAFVGGGILGVQGRVVMNEGLGKESGDEHDGCRFPIGHGTVGAHKDYDGDDAMIDPLLKDM